MLPTFVIGLREGLEAALIVGIIAAFLSQQGRRDALRWVWLGVVIAVALCGLAAWGLHVAEENLPQREQEQLETVIALVAVGMITWMIVSSCSCSRWGRFSSATWRPQAAAPHSSTAIRTPSHIHRRASRRPCCVRNAAMIPTISAASRPSRRPMTKVGSTPLG